MQPRRHLSAGLFVITALVSGCATAKGREPAVAAEASHFTIRITAAPAGTPAAPSIFVAGNFNGWNPGDSAYRLTPDGKGNYLIALPDSVRGNLEFKFTRGSWESVETDSAGRGIQNRS